MIYAMNSPHFIWNWGFPDFAIIARFLRGKCTRPSKGHAEKAEGLHARGSTALPDELELVNQRKQKIAV